MQGFKKIEDAEQDAQNAMNTGDIKTAVEKLAESAQYKEDIKAWQTGGDKKQMVTAIATALSLTVAGRPTEAIAVGTTSPYVNEVIKDITSNPKLQGLNIPLHALWGAVEAHLSGGNATTGAIAGGGGEALALLLTEKAYGKKPADLTEAEKQELINIVKGVTGLVSAVTTKGNLAENLATASTGMKIAENAVEFNSFGDDIYPFEERRQTIEMMAKAMFKGDIEKAEEYYDRHQAEINKAQLKTYATILAFKAAPMLATNSSLIAGGMGASSDLVGQLIDNKGDISKVDKTKVVISGAVGAVTKDMGILKTTAINTATEVGYTYKTGEDPIFKGGSTAITTFVGGVVGKGAEMPLNKVINPNWKNYIEIKGHLPYGISKFYEPSHIPSITGNVLDNITSKTLENRIQNRFKYINEMKYEK